jgi:hypothetical protein
LKKILFILFVLGWGGLLQAQELRCQVKIISAQVQGQGVEARVFTGLETAITEFMNNRKWTGDNFSNIEKIDCNILINITKIVSANTFQATMEIQSRRPVFSSSYNTVLLNYSDNAFTFTYIENQPLEFAENTYLNNLTSVLAFYAYYLIGLDYDSYSLNGGTPHYQKALNIVNSVTGDAASSWNSGSRNRYWMVNNMLDASFVPLRESMYKYHRLGLDIMSQNKEAGRKVITESLEGLLKIHAIKPLSFSVQMFFNAKSDEVISIYTGATTEEKSKIVPILGKIDPTNSNKYMKITSSN